MLGVALGAIVLGCLLMFLILWRYEFKANAKLAALDSGARVLTVQAESPESVVINPPSARLGRLQRRDRTDGAILPSPLRFNL
jgi:hypothetical protein